MTTSLELVYRLYILFALTECVVIVGTGSLMSVYLVIDQNARISGKQSGE